MNPELENLREKANKLPLLPGVYIMLDEHSDIIYIGKAKSLKNRVTSYFHGDHLPKVAAMVDNVRDFNIIIAESEFEALILENSLIKRHKPHYNILLKDDKGYPFIRFDINDDYPRMEIVSKPDKDKAKYFGPFGGRGVTRSIIESVNKALLLPQCSRKFENRKYSRPCLNYQIGNCEGWCTKQNIYNEFKSRSKIAEEILSGNSKELIDSLTYQMEQSAEELNFEKAASIRDRIRAIEGISNHQRVIKTAFADTDAIGLTLGAVTCFSVLHFINGDLIDKETFIIDEPLEEENAAIADFILRYYSERTGYCPQNIIVQSVLEDAEILEELLSEKNPRKVHIINPQKGEKKNLLDMAVLNSREEILRRTTEKNRTFKILELLKKMLCLSDVPRRIESFDISNLGDTGIVSAMVVFSDGKPLKRDYRKFRIRDLSSADDYASMYQTVYRRFKRYTENDDKFSSLPDLLLIDGGEAHANIAQKAVKELNLSIPVFGMVKDDHHKTRALISPEGDEISIINNPAVFSFIGRIQEETHRFAIEYQRSIRMEGYGSSLDDISGIGAKRKADLIKYFKTVKGIKNAGIDELKKVVPESTAAAVYNYFHGE